MQCLSRLQVYHKYITTCVGTWQKLPPQGLQIPISTWLPISPSSAFQLEQLEQAEEGQHWERGSAGLDPNSGWWQASRLLPPQLSASFWCAPFFSPRKSGHAPGAPLSDKLFFDSIQYRYDMRFFSRFDTITIRY